MLGRSVIVVQRNGGCTLMCRRLLAASSGYAKLCSATPPGSAIDVVWMHNGWQFLIPTVQQQLDRAITSHACTVREARYAQEPNDSGPPTLQLDSLAGAHVLIPAMAAVTAAALDAAGPNLRLVYQPAVDSSRIDLEACAARGVVVCNSPGR